MPKSSSLSLAMRPKSRKDGYAAPLSPRSPGSPKMFYGNESESVTPTASYHSIPESPSSPKQRKDSRSIFSNFHASRSSSRIMAPENSIRQVSEQDVPKDIHTDGQDGASTPDLIELRGAANTEDNYTELTYAEGQRNALSGKAQDVSDQIVEPNVSADTAPKPKKPGVLSRSRSIKVEEGSNTLKKRKGEAPRTLPEPTATSWKGNEDTGTLKTAPMEKGQSWRQNISFGKLRTHSAERHDGSRETRPEEEPASRKDKAEQSSLASGSFNESRGAALMSSLNSASRKMGEKMGTARKGMFGKLGRSSSNHEKDLQIPKEQYQFKVINRPLVEQTRLTRISSRLEHSKDKTEFWMPALPWRCIDYLNMRGCEEEGLYRVPGAAHTVRYYEQKFDQERDIDLIADDNLNDPNVIGSLFKNWLRQLPDEIFPKSIQARIQQECQGAKSTPQLLKDELSRLPPFNYYLLFAITCHISLLHSCSEYNKMNYNNLCICFQPAIKIDAFCFQFLILDWRNCWQGCWTEKEYLAKEMEFLEAPSPRPITSRSGYVPGKLTNMSSSGYLGEGFKDSSIRSNSSDRAAASEYNKPPTRGHSSERNLSAGRATLSNPSFTSQDSQSQKNRVDPGLQNNGALLSERVSSSSESNEGTSSRARRAPPGLRTDASGEEDDNGATPTQARHGRGLSEVTYRLDLTNPPSSPFSIKF